MLASLARDITLKTPGRCRNLVAGLDLTFDNPVLR
jgi:hypothetical protein